ncbi:DUF1501 domain-containing protein [Zavarzinella formosa]|uniref:DUF1501 domain-containing protein n=1 Tax=Zavarzinella formosa TaxID=360055 RepID=UPI00030E5AB0|nr:DUF1501 domain-containing protein [Zavarzinella formosa]
MIQLSGTSRRLCHGLTRRDFLHIGGLGALGLNVGTLSGSPTAPTAKAKACILLFLYGSPPQHETFDPKPEAPREVQGELSSIPTSVSGVRFCEGLPKIAKIANELTVVRSMTHPYPVHGVAYAISGLPTYDPSLEAKARDSRHWPFIGSVVDYLEDKSGSSPSSSVPRNIALPWMLNSKTDLLVNAGPFAAFLGQNHDPVWTDYTGKGVRTVPRYTDGQTKDFVDPFGGCTTDGRFQLSDAAVPSADLSPERLDHRLSLLGQFDKARRQNDQSMSRSPFDRQRAQAHALLTSDRIRSALDVTRESLAVRETYGMTLFGQGCLAARRLVEAGSKFITVFWDGYGQFGNCAWDTHNNHFPRLKEYLLPGFDLAYSGLIDDLKSRGLLDETLVLCVSEHGRAPQIDSKPKGAGRHHWSRVYSAVFAGGGFARGKVVGASDKIGGDVKDCPVSPKDVLATTFHQLGYDPHSTVPDTQGRPLPIAGDGQVRAELLA